MTRFYRVTRELFLPVSRLLFELDVEGAEKIPLRGGAVLVAPHRSWLDPPCVGAATSRVIRFLILDRVYAKPWANWFYRRMRGIPVAQTGHGSLSALRDAMKALKQGSLIGVFPEGRVLRPGETGKIHPGAALLAARCRVPIVPIGIHGTAEAWPLGRKLPRRGRVRLVVGDPLDAPADASRDSIAILVAEIESSLEMLSREACS